MTFNIGDKVKIKDVGFKNSYKNIIDQVGFIADIMSYHSVVMNADITKYYVDVPNHRNEYQANGHYVFDNTDCLELVKEPVWCGLVTIDPAEPKITIKKEKETMEILEFYKNVKKGEILRKKTKALEKLKSKHPVINAVKNFADMMKDVKGFVFNWDFDWDEDKEFYKKIEETENRYDKQMDEFDANYREIKALLTDCETYEQKQNILKAYGIIDEHGKLRK